jgi:hypothetical protein
MPDYGYNQPYTIPDLGFEPLPFEPDGGPGRSLYFTDGSPWNTNNVGDIYNSGAVAQGSLQPSNFQPSPTSFGIGGFEQPYQQQNMGSLGFNQQQNTGSLGSNQQQNTGSLGFNQQQNTGSLGSNKPTANVLF